MTARTVPAGLRRDRATAAAVYPAAMLRAPIAVLAAVAASVTVAGLIAGHYPDEGPYVSISATHGIHAGDVVLLALWAVLMRLLWRWAARRRRPHSPDRPG